MKLTLSTAIGIGGLLSTAVDAVTIDVTQPASVKAAANTLAQGMLSYYTGNQPGGTPGTLNPPYYWWEAGGMLLTLVDYYWLTGDKTFVNETLDAIVFQTGPNNDFMPANQTDDEGNDDQGFWALATMAAAENVFPNPPSGDPQWLALTQAVFNEYVSRWDTQFCGGGLRWQIENFMNGWNYKNSIANGCFFNIGARLSRYTGNQTYATWASKIYDWQVSAGLISSDFEVFDGVQLPAAPQDKCTDIDTIQWTYNVGIYLYGAAVMWNMTEDAVWKTRVNGFLSTIISKFVKDNILYEQFCENAKQCDVDQQSFKGYTLGFMAKASQLAPWTYQTISPVLSTTAQAAASVCSGSSATFPGTQGQACGFSWLQPGTFDGFVGIGEEIDAVNAVIFTLIPAGAAPVTAHSGGTSKGNPNAGNLDPNAGLPHFASITTGDKAGAAIVTILLIGGLLAFCAFPLV